MLGGPGDVVVRSTWPDALDDLDDVDLLVLNSGRGRADPDFDGDDGAWTAFHERLAAWARDGGSLLALHQAANTFADAPGFERILGGRWIPGTSMHPPIGTARFDVVPDHPITDGLGPIDAFDERYCHLRVADASHVLVTTTGPERPGFGSDDGTRVHAVAWAHTAHGGRTVYSGMGHDVRSFAAPAHRDFLRAAARWLLADR